MKKLLILATAATMALGAMAVTPQLSTLGRKAPASSLPAEMVPTHSVGRLAPNGQLRPEAKAASGMRRAKALVTPEGTPVPYTYGASIYLGSPYGFVYYGGISVSLSFSDDGNRVYFNNMFPNSFYNDEAWVQGNISTDGTRVTVPCDVPIFDIEERGVIYTVYPVELVVDNEMNVVGVKDIELVKDGGRIYIDDNTTRPTRYIALINYDANGEPELWDQIQLLTYDPVEADMEVVELPEGAEPSEFIFNYSNAFGLLESKKGLVYVDGSDVYMNGLAPGIDAWLKGTQEGNTVTFKSGQFLGGDVFLFYFQALYTDGTVDATGALTPYPTDEYVLTYDPETGYYENPDATRWSSVVTPDLQLYNYGNQYSIRPYTGDVPAIPSDPYDLYLEDWSYFGQTLLGYTLDNKDINGYFINPDCLAYYIYMDGQIFEFTVEDYPALSESMTLVPYGFTDGWNIMNGMVFISEALFNEVSVQAVYTVDGVTNYSNVVSIDRDGNVTTVSAPQVDPIGISNVDVKHVTRVEFFDAEGRKLMAPQQGINLMKMVTADGSEKTVKIYRK